MTGNDNLLHVGEQSSVVKVLDDLVKHSVRAGVLGGIRVLVVASRRPLRSLPDECVRGRAAAGLEAVSPGVTIVLVVSVREVRCHDGD